MQTRRELPAGVVETVPNKAAELEMFGKLTRETFEWHPAKLLCKRFNIPEPYPSSKTVGLIQERKEKFNLGQLFKSSADDTGQQSADTNNSSTVSSTSLPQRLPEPARQNTTGNQEEKVTQAVSNEQAIKEKPSMDLFKAIFASSSEDESGESQSEGEEEEEDIKSVETAVTSTSHVAGNSSQDVSSDGVHHPKGVSVSMDTTSGESQAKASRDENAADRDSVEEPVYGPKPPPPPPSGKTEGAPKPQFKPHQTVPFSGLGSESDSDVSESKTRKKHKRKHKHKQKGREKERERQKEKRKEGGKGGERGKWKEREKEGERVNEIHDRVKAKNSREVCKKNIEGSKPNDIPDDKEILSKLKAVQKRRMRASDFM